MRIVVAAAVVALSLLGCTDDSASGELDGRSVRVESELRGGCAMTPDGCPDPVVIEDVATVSEETTFCLTAADDSLAGVPELRWLHEQGH